MSPRQPGPWRPGPPPKGNTWHLVHGADSDRALEARAAELRPRLIELCPWLEEIDVVAVSRFLRVEARSLVLDRYMAEIIDTAGPGKVPVRMWEQANATDRLAADLGNRLGLDSAGRAQLRQTVASTEHTLADLAADGRSTVGFARVHELAVIEGDDQDGDENGR
jgi:hypothetical protein